MGPESGGTVIEIAVDDLPKINTNYYPDVYCSFPGYETQPEIGKVKGVFVSLNLIQCVTPPFKLSDEGIANGSIADRPTFATVRVEFALVNFRAEQYFEFTYYKDVRVF
jgi:hypothetical protein